MNRMGYRSNVVCRLLAGVLFVCATAQLHAQSNEQGWVNLFDGKTFNGWKQVAGDAQYAIENGMIVGTTVAGTPNTFLRTEQEYDDFVLELDVKIEDTTSNSGIQFRSRYDAQGNKGKGKVYGYQFELDPSARAWTGGIYDEGRRDWLYPLMLHPEARSAYRHGVFNTIRVECSGNEIKTWVNGVPAAYLVDTVDRKGLIALQVHGIGNNSALAGRKIWWKNIRIRTGAFTPTPFPPGVYVVNNIPNSITPYERQSGWKLLYNGVNSDGWIGAYKQAFPEHGWETGKGMMKVLASEGKESTNGGDIVTTEQFSAFDLSFEFKLTPGANSGVKYFVTLSENNTGSAIGLEYQVLDDDAHPDAKMGRNGNRTLASLYDLITAQKQPRFVHKIGEWNTGRIIVYPNNHVEHYLNGIKVLEYERGSQAFRDLVAISKYKIWINFGEAVKGHILLQDHGNEVSYRSIKIRPLQ